MLNQVVSSGQFENFEVGSNQKTDSMTSSFASEVNRLAKCLWLAVAPLPKVLVQEGHVCKIVVLANVDFFWSNLAAIANIPLRKNHRNVYESMRNQYGDASRPLTQSTSVRALSKQYGSVQGEILSLSMFTQIANSMGYNAQVFKPNNYEEFLSCVRESLTKSIPLVGFFILAQENEAISGHPGFKNPFREHACVIQGLSADGMLSIAHWGERFNDVSSAAFYQSMNALLTSRESEFYAKVQDPTKVRAGYYVKYDLVHPMDVFEERAQYTLAVDSEDKHRFIPGSIQKSMDPQKTAGFKNVLVQLTPSLRHERWKQSAVISNILQPHLWGEQL